MDLEDRHRGARVVARRPAGDPLVVVPLVTGREHPGSGGGGHLGGHRERIGVVDGPAVGAADAVLVDGVVGHVRYEQFPHSRAADRTHGQGDRVPPAEVAHHADAPGVRGPDGEGRPGEGPPGGVVRADVRTEDGPQPLVPTLVDQVEIHLAESGQEAVPVGHDPRVPVRVGHPEPVVGDVPLGQPRPEHAVAERFHGHRARPEHDLHRGGTGLHGPHDRTGPGRVGAVDRVRVAVGAGAEGVELLAGDPARRRVGGCRRRGPPRLVAGDLLGRPPGRPGVDGRWHPAGRRGGALGSGSALAVVLSHAVVPQSTMCVR